MFAIPFHIADEKTKGISVYRVGLCFNLLQNRYFLLLLHVVLLFPLVRANVPDPNMLPNLTRKVHFYHLSNEKTVLISSSGLATAVSPSNL